MDFLKLILISAASVAALFVLAKIMGNKQMSELSMFDYIIGITIGSIAAEMATELEKPWRPLAAMAVYAVLSVGFSLLSAKSLAFRRFGFGKTQVLYKDGMLYRENLKRAKMDINELLVGCRNNGYFDLNELKLILLEPNGRLSFMPYSARRPAKPSDMQIVPPEDCLLYSVIIDGKIMKRNLSAAGHTESWLMSQLKTQNISDVGEVFLATCDKSKLNVYKRNDIPKTEDFFL